MYGETEPAPAAKAYSTYDARSSTLASPVPTITPGYNALSSPVINEGGPDTLVVVWDFDDTLVPWYRMKRGSSSSGAALFEKWFNANQAVQKQHLDGDHPAWEAAMCLTDLPGSIQSKVRRVHGDARESTLPSFRSEFSAMEAETENLYGNWMRTARNTLSEVEAKGGLNMLLTAAPLCAAYAKCSVFGFSRYFAPEHVYSASEDSSGKTGTMDSATRFAERVCAPRPARFLSCGDGSAEMKAAKKLRIPHVHVSGAQSLSSVLRHC